MRYTLLITGCMFTVTRCFAAPPREDRLIFPLQAKHVHSSSMVECPNGDLLACWFRGSGERQSPDVLVQGARWRHGAARWGHPFVMADTPAFPDCNPVLFIDAQQRLWLFWIAVLAERWEDSLLRYRRASDFAGPGPPRWAWQDDILLRPGPGFSAALRRGLNQVDAPGMGVDFGGYVTGPRQQLFAAANDPSKRQRGWMTRTQPLILPSGRILLPLYSDGYYVALMAISDDQGKTWRASAPIVGAGLNQPAIVRKRDGTLVAYLREEGEINRRVLRSTSSDDGETWSVAVSTEIPNPNSSLDVVALRDGRWVMVYNDSERDRHSLAVALSDNEGQSWKWKRHLECQTGGQFHYPCVIQSRTGRIHVSYTFQPNTGAGKSIKHVVLDPAWIAGGN